MNGAGSKFSLQVQGWAEKVGIKADLVFQDILIDIASRTILATPVGNPAGWQHPPKKGNSANAMGSGMLRANWQIGSGAPPEGTITAPDVSGLATIGSINSQVISSGAFKSGTVAYLVNNLPYALPIEYGAGENPYAPNSGWHGSKQAPAGMLRLSVQAYEAEFEQRVAQIGGLA